MCNELGGLPEAAGGAAPPRERSGFPPASWGPASADRQLGAGGGCFPSEGQAATFCGRRARGTGQEGLALTVKSNALSFRAVGSGQGPRALLGPLGSRRAPRFWCCPLPAGPPFPLGRPQQSPRTGRHEHPLVFPASPRTWSLAIAKEKSGPEVLPSPGG